ncbi:MAG: conjugative transfer protein [Clostridia bacterium]|nr:conjugative transfer protein [Clostridia bacterium]
MKQAHKPVEGRPPVGNSSLIFDRAPCAVKAARTVLSGGKSGEKQLSKDYLSQSGAKSQGIKQFMAGAGVAIIGLTLVPLLNNLFTVT